MVPLSTAIGAGLNETAASLILVTCLGVYGLWLHWFLARKALSLTALRAALLVVVVNLGTLVAVMTPHMLANALG
jgi:hypothetical protein